MKKIFITAAVVFLSTSIHAQNIELIKSVLLLGQYQRGREDIDKAMADAKFRSKPEAYILKAAAYAGLASDKTNNSAPQKDEFAGTADAAFKKYREMDPAMGVLKDQLYQDCIIRIYSAYYTSGYNDYSDKKWDAAFGKLKKAVEYSDLLIEKKLITASVDTNVLILAGVTAENSGNTIDAANYYSRLADNRITGNGFESVYRFLVSYYFRKKDLTAFEKYKGIGASLYPGSEYFTYDAVDFAVGLETDLNKKIKALEDAIALRPNDDKAYEVLGEVIYDTLDSRKEGAVPPANAAELEKKMISAFNKVSSLKPDYVNPLLYLGDHFINKAVGIDDARQKLAVELKAKTKLSAADNAKREALDQDYGAVLNKAKEPYEKAAALYAKKQTLEKTDKQQYRKAASYLADIADFNKIRARSNPAEQAKWAAEEKKWNDLYESLK